MKQATIRDVAKLAGVSVATASRALNDPTYPVSAQYRQKVRDAAAQLEYSPNAIARSLRGSGNRDIGLVIPNVSNPFYLQAMLGINDVLIKNGYSMILCNTMRDVEQERGYLRQLYERQTKGVILSPLEENAEIVKEYARRGMKFVLLDQKIPGLECPEINFDIRAGARMAAEYLISQNHTRIAFATLPMNRWTRIEMFQGYREALLTAGIEVDEELTYICPTDHEAANRDLELCAGQHIAEAFLHSGCPATAIMCINDMVAIGVIQTLLKEGKRVPEDISVVGFDDITFASAFLPALTTVHYPATEVGRLATLMMLDTLNDAKSELSLSMKLTPSMVIRDTVSPYRK